MLFSGKRQRYNAWSCYKEKRHWGISFWYSIAFKNSKYPVWFWVDHRLKGGVTQAIICERAPQCNTGRRVHSPWISVHPPPQGTNCIDDIASDWKAKVWQRLIKRHLSEDKRAKLHGGRSRFPAMKLGRENVCRSAATPPLLRSYLQSLGPVGPALQRRRQ